MSAVPLYHVIRCLRTGQLLISTVNKNGGICQGRGVKSDIASTGVSRSYVTAPPEDPTVGMCPGPYESLGGGAVSYEQGTPVVESHVVVTGFGCDKAPDGVAVE